MRTYGTVTVAKQMYVKDKPPAGPVVTYQEDFEERVARLLQRMIRQGKPVTKEQREKRRETVQAMIMECVRELDRMKEAEA